MKIIRKYHLRNGSHFVQGEMSEHASILIQGHMSAGWLSSINFESSYKYHYSDVLMGMMVSQITSLAGVYQLNHLFRHKSKKTSKLRVTGLCARNSPVTGEFPAQMASNAENVSIWWRHHVLFFSPASAMFVPPGVWKGKHLLACTVYFFTNILMYILMVSWSWIFMSGSHNKAVIIFHKSPLATCKPDSGSKVKI